MNRKNDIDSSNHNNLLQRLLLKDTTLWTKDPMVAADIQQRLGWLDAISFSCTQVQRLNRFRDRVRAEGFDQVILLGMGGSSLAPEVFAHCFNVDQRNNFTVLDTTFPDVIQRVTTEASRGMPLFIVSSKSGTTAETLALRKHFWHWGQAKYGNTVGDHFIAITDEQSDLHLLALKHGYREIFLNPADIGGRFSALSLFGLVPASLLNIDIVRLLDGAHNVFSDGPQARLALQLGLMMGHAERQGRDKLTLTFSTQLMPLGAWIEQLVAESTGKEGKGIVPIIDESAALPSRYEHDRVFVDISLHGDMHSTQRFSEWHQELEQLGHPVLSEQLENIYELGAEFAKWQVATAVASAIIGVNPFDEPDVNATKVATNQLLRQPESANADLADQRAVDEQAIDLGRFLHGLGGTDYVAVLAYLPAGDHYGQALQKLRYAIAQRNNCATCLAIGPRYLHSSGQLHKGGPKIGYFLFLTAAATEDIAVPGQSYGFQHLINAQACADIAVLRQRGQKVLHIDLGQIETAGTAIRRLADQLTG